VRVHAAKTRIAFINRMTFAAATPMKDRLRCHVILPRRVESARFTTCERYSPTTFGHYFYVRSRQELDPELANLLRDAYRRGMQQMD